MKEEEKALTRNKTIKAQMIIWLGMDVLSDVRLIPTFFDNIIMSKSIKLRKP